MFSHSVFAPALQWLAALAGMSLAGSLWLLWLMLGDSPPPRPWPFDAHGA